MLSLFFTILVSAMGSYLFYRMKIPAGALIGALLFSAVFHILTGCGSFPSSAKVLVQAVAGAFIGQRVTKKELSELRATLCGGFLMLGCMLAYTVLVGWLLSAITTLKLPTALVAAMPAGLSDTAIIASDLGADPTQSTLLATFRTLYSLLVLPQLANRVCLSIQTAHGKPGAQESYEPRSFRHSGQSKKDILLTLFLAESAGILGTFSGIPAGAMTFSVIAVAILNVKWERACLPKRLKLLAQCITGLLIGIRVTMDDVRNLKALLFPVLLLFLCATICNYVCSFLLYKVAKLDLFTSLFGSIPAGVSDMALIATDLGGSAPKVSVLQLVRYIGVFTVMPGLIKLLTGG
ncbi:MAG: hypothetical protein HFE84_07280 [Lachnospiraceae bacterium]|nr:hypothetical protein [Lachnospiraceae bacterium]